MEKLGLQVLLSRVSRELGVPHTPQDREARTPFLKEQEQNLKDVLASLLARMGGELSLLCGSRHVRLHSPGGSPSRSLSPEGGSRWVRCAP